MRLISSTRHHFRHALFLAIGLGMLSAFGVRAFTAARGALARRPVARSVPPTTTTTTARFMSFDPDTSVVDVCTQKIGEALETSDVKVTGAYDDPNGSHISIEVVSSQFEGKRPMQRQQLVYKAIWEELQGPVHAVDSMVCKTPEEN